MRIQAAAPVSVESVLEKTVLTSIERRPPCTRCSLYVRASTTKRTRTTDGEEYRQRPEIQEERLRRMCEQRGWQVAGVYCDRASGRKEARPELQRLMDDARRGEFDVVAVAAFDRFARSVKHLVLALEEFRALGIQFVSLREAIDTSTPMGKAMFTIIGAMAELESALISERTAAAMEYARAHGTRTGNPIGRQRNVFRRDLADDLLRQGKSYREVGRVLGIPVATLHSGLQDYARRSERGKAATPPCVPQEKAETDHDNRSAKRPLLNDMGLSEHARKKGTEL
jgi:DNA invertase Pin-like site-specific DNA recombinase